MITAPRGFRAAGVACGIKPAARDLALLVAEQTVPAAAVFTRNRAAAAPVRVSREHVASGRARAIVVNSGCANAATGPAGLADARAMAEAAAAALGCAPAEVLVASTGVIGVALPMERVREGIARAAAALSPAGSAAAAEAILTTDTRPKQTVVECAIDRHTVRIGAMAKGAGMIAPNMATLLAFFSTDARIEPTLLQRALVSAVGETLNRITVDGDTSTNDMAAILASGRAEAPMIDREGPAFDVFEEALREAAWRMAEALLRDAEGATRIAEVRVDGARSGEDADRIARTIAESPLVKTALHGGDPNWGRVLAAAGRAGVDLDAGQMDVWLGEVLVAARGAACDYDESAAHAAIRTDPALIRVRVGSGPGRGSIWTCDLSHGYVDVNAHYRS